jgi:hypothetical protein
VVEKGLPFDRAVNIPLKSVLPRNGLIVSGLACNDPLIAQRLPSAQRILLPDFYVNALLQTKVSSLVSRRKTENAKQWDTCGGAFYRSKLDLEQHKTLMSLESDLGGIALVRYAMPCFWSWSDLRTMVLSQSVTGRSHFQSPCRIGAHAQYAYQSPLRPGYGFSEPELVEVTSYSEDLLSALRLSPPLSLLESVASLWYAIVYGFGENEEILAPTPSDRDATKLLLGSEWASPLTLDGITNPDSRRMAELLLESGEPTLGHFLERVFRLEHHFKSVHRCEWSIATVW